MFLILLQSIKNEGSSGGLLSNPFIAYAFSIVILVSAAFAIVYYKRKVQLLEEYVKEKEFQAKMVRGSYTSFFENSPIMYFVLNPGAILVSCNQRVFEQLKYSRKELIGKSLKPYFETDPDGEFDKYLKNLIKEKTGSFKVIFKDANDTKHKGKAYCAATVNMDDEISNIQMVVLLYDGE